MKTRLALSLALLLAAGYIGTLWNSVSTVGAGRAAALQLDSSDASYVASQAGARLFGGGWAPVLIAALTLLALFLLWRKPVGKWLKRGAWVAGAASAALLSLLGDWPAAAYYDKSDYAEPYFIMPNESAFWVPDVGDNKASQTKFGSEQYFQENKIAAKRFVITHTKLENSGLFSNFFVPAGRLIIVDRTPYSREWVTSEKRGTSKANQGFPCQSNEGMNMTVGMSIGVSVLEENAAKYLYRFGVNPPEGDRTKPEVVFQSVLHSRSLTTVMDQVGRNKVQALVCNEIGSRTFDLANAEAVKMMQSVKDAAEKYLASVGITLDYLGWADTITFDGNVQKAINDKYIADKIGSSMSVLMQNADNAVKEGLGNGLSTKGLPSNLVVLPSNMDIHKLFSGSAAPTK